jgi:hypothetical protein
MHHLFDVSGGIPRRINQFCHLALLAGVNTKAEQISPDLLNEVQELAVPQTEASSLEKRTPTSKSFTKSASKNKKKTN